LCEFLCVDTAQNQGLMNTSLTSTTSESGNGAQGSSIGSSSLVLRESGRGRGMVVPGLWEVEIASGSDIEAVVNHVQVSKYTKISV
jgi:hypothetical protein